MYIYTYIYIYIYAYQHTCMHNTYTQNKVQKYSQKHKKKIHLSNPREHSGRKKQQTISLGCVCQERSDIKSARQLMPLTQVCLRSHDPYVGLRRLAICIGTTDIYASLREHAPVPF